MLCRSFDLGRPCPNPARPASNHCSSHDPEPVPNPFIPKSWESDPEGFLEELTHNPTLLGEPLGTHEEPFEERVELVKFSEMTPERVAPAVLHPCELPDDCDICYAGPHQCHTSVYDHLCGFAARRDRAWCINHDPTYAGQQHENARKGGRNSVASRRAARDPLPTLALNIGTRAGIQAAIDLIIRLELSGQIAPTRSRNILRALAVAARNFDRDPQAPASHNMYDYLDLREHIETFIPETLAQARLLDQPGPRPTSQSPNPNRDLERALAQLERLLR